MVVGYVGSGKLQLRMLDWCSLLCDLAEETHGLPDYKNLVGWNTVQYSRYCCDGAGYIVQLREARSHSRSLETTVSYELYLHHTMARYYTNDIKT